MNYIWCKDVLSVKKPLYTLAIEAIYFLTLLLQSFLKILKIFFEFTEHFHIIFKMIFNISIFCMQYYFIWNSSSKSRHNVQPFCHSLICLVSSILHFLVRFQFIFILACWFEQWLSRFRLSVFILLNNYLFHHHNNLITCCRNWWRWKLMRKNYSFTNNNFACKKLLVYAENLAVGNGLRVFF